MLDAFFWITGLLGWVWIALMGASMIVINAHERFEMKRAARNGAGQ